VTYENIVEKVTTIIQLNNWTIILLINSLYTSLGKPLLPAIHCRLVERRANPFIRALMRSLVEHGAAADWQALRRFRLIHRAAVIASC
jgi:hypothetical protein